jgi:hypothetical protein
MSLEKRLESFNRDRCALLDELATLEPDKLTARPLVGKWSILEIVEHMVLAERFIFRGLPAPSTLKEREPELRHTLRYLLVMAVLRARIPVPVPAAGMKPVGSGDLAVLRRLWDENQSWLSTYIAARKEKPSRSTALKHPAVGPLTLGQAIRMGQVHLDLHTRQIRRLQRMLA